MSFLPVGSILPVNGVNGFRQRADPAFTDSRGVRRPAIGVSGAGNRRGNGIRDSPVMAPSAPVRGKHVTGTGQERTGNRGGRSRAGPRPGGLQTFAFPGSPAGRRPRGCAAVQSRAVRQSRAVSHGDPGPYHTAVHGQNGTAAQGRSAWLPGPRPRAIPAVPRETRPDLRRAVLMRIRKRGKCHPHCMPSLI